MTTDTLRQMSHEALVAYVKRCVTAQRAAGTAKQAPTPTAPLPSSTGQNASTSTYVRHPGVAPAKIAPYPKRRPVSLPASRPAGVSVSASQTSTADLSYADFFLSDQHAQLIAS